MPATVKSAGAVTIVRSTCRDIKLYTNMSERKTVATVILNSDLVPDTTLRFSHSSL